MRNWSAILVDAGIRGLNCTQVARETGAPAYEVFKAAQRYGIHIAPARGVYPARRAEPEWRALFADAPHGETITQFCLRANCAQGTAAYWAKRLNHAFAPTTGGRKPWAGKAHGQGRPA